jgi:hypothetical protein
MFIQRNAEVDAATNAAISKVILLRPEKAAALLGVTEGSLAVWRSTKRYPLKYIRVGRVIRYRLTDIEEFLRIRGESGDGDKKPRSKRRRASSN